VGKANIRSCRTFVVCENGLFLADTSKYAPYSSIARPQFDYQDKQDFRGIDLNLDDGSRVWLKVEGGHGKLRDAFAVSAFLRHLLRRLKQSHPSATINQLLTIGRAKDHNAAWRILDERSRSDECGA